MRAIELQTYSEVTAGIRITVFPQYLEEESSAATSEFAFAYTITIENMGGETTQLLSRHWHVASGGVPYNEVQGDGVVGEQPSLKPGEAFQYTSGVIIPDPVGSMYGTYTFRTVGDRVFQVAIPRFDLVCPALVH